MPFISLGSLDNRTAQFRLLLQGYAIVKNIRFGTTIAIVGVNNLGPMRCWDGLLKMAF